MVSSYRDVRFGQRFIGGFVRKTGGAVTGHMVHEGNLAFETPFIILEKGAFSCGEGRKTVNSRGG